MKIKRSAAITWRGGFKDGKGAISTQSGALAGYPYGYASRFEGQRGTNPEELLGASHAACFTMALSMLLSQANLSADLLETRAEVTLEQVADGFAITSIHLTLTARIPGMDQTHFDDIANKAKSGCPISKALKTEITLESALVS